MSEALKEANVTSELISVLNRCEAAFAILAATGDKNCKELLADIWKAKEAALSRSAPDREALKESLRETLAELKWILRCGSAQRIEPPQATQQVIAEAEKRLAESPSESAPAPEGAAEPGIGVTKQ